MSDRGPRPPGWFWALTMTAMTILVVGLVALFAALQDATGGGATPPSKSADVPSVLFVGDSYGAGYIGMSAAETFPCRTAQQLGWQCLLDVQGATGYGADGSPLITYGRSYGERLPTTKETYPDPDYIVVTGGRNDDPNGIGTAALLYLTALKADYPDAKILVCEPFWIGPASPSITQARTAVHDVVTQLGLTWVPTDGWLPASTMSADLVHPTAEGQTDLVERMTTVLEDVSEGKTL